VRLAEKVPATFPGKVPATFSRFGRALAAEVAAAETGARRKDGLNDCNYGTCSIAAVRENYVCGLSEL
jgi:hypothetical protein